MESATTALKEAKEIGDTEEAEQQARVAQAWRHSRQQILEGAKETRNIARQAAAAPRLSWSS